MVFSSPSSLAPADLRHNRLHPGDRAFHDWYRFILSYPPHLVRDYLQQFALDASAVVLDPFCGTGTTLVEAKKQGLTAVGVEAVPMAHFACATKTQWAVDIAALETMVGRTLERTAERMVAVPLRTFAPTQQALVMRNAINPLPLHKCLVLGDAIAVEPPSPERDILNLALAYVAVQDASNLRFGPEVGLRRKHREDAPVLASWQTKVAQMAADIAAWSHCAGVPTHCHRGDARTLRSLLEPHSIDAIITSPPYPNEKDYTRTTRLESVLLGYLKNKQDLRAFKETLIRSNSRNVYRLDDDDQVLSRQSQIRRLARTIEAKRIALGKTSGFECKYHRVTTLYFGGIKRHLLDLQGALRPGAQLAYVVGDQASFFQILIRTGELLAEIAEEAGYQVKGIDLFRTRGASATGTQLREEVVRLEWRGIATQSRSCVLPHSKQGGI